MTFTSIPFVGADDRLSRCCTALRTLQREVDGIAEDLRAYNAPSECGTLAYRGVERKALAMIYAHGYDSIDCFMDAVEERTSPRWNYFSGGFAMLFPDSE